MSTCAIMYWEAFGRGSALLALTSLLKTCTGTHPIVRNLLNKKSTSHSGPRIAANSYELVRIAENRRNSIPYLGPYPLKYHEFKKHFAWTDFL